MHNSNALEFPGCKSHLDLPDSGDACGRDGPAVGADGDGVVLTDLLVGNLKNSSVTAVAGSGPGRNLVRVLLDSLGIASSPSRETFGKVFFFFGFHSSGPLFGFVVPRGAMFRKVGRLS